MQGINAFDPQVILVGILLWMGNLILLVDCIFICNVISRRGALIFSSRQRVNIWMLGKFFGIAQVTLFVLC